MTPAVLGLPGGMTLPSKPVRAKPFPRETGKGSFTEYAQKWIREQWHGEVVKTHGGPAAVAGTPDLLICLGGRFVAIELKQPGNKPTPRQLNKLRHYEAAGAIAGWATTMEQVDALLIRVLEPAGAWLNPQLQREAPS